MKIFFYFLFLIVIIASCLLIFNCQRQAVTNITQIINYQAGLIRMAQVSEITNFTMGSILVGSGTPEHTVPFISSFKIGKYEVTYEEWRIVRTWALTNGYTFANLGKEGHNGTIGADSTTRRNEPVTYINWRDCIVWCNAASQKDGFTPVYYADSGFSGILKDSSDGIYGSSINTAAGSFDNPYVNWSANGYRLPTEAEWEVSARYQDGAAWTPGSYASGATADYNDAAATDNVAWHTGNSLSTTHDAGTKNPNQLFIYDMSGNIFEFCWDWLDTYTTSAPYTDNNPRGPAAGSNRVLRGGCWNFPANSLRVAGRSGANPYFEDGSFGFRLCRSY